MPTSTIPYDPSLVLGMIVDPSRIQVLEQIAQAQLPVDTARDHVNALLRQKLSLDMTARELISLGAKDDQLTKLYDNMTTLMDDIIDATNTLADNVMEAEKAIVAVKMEAGQAQIGSQLMSPIDFAASKLQAMPLSSDSLSMDVQYFRYEDNEQSSNSTANAISSFVGGKVSSFLGSSFAASMAASANQSVASATTDRKILGTLVICANCTSREAQIFSPVKLDVETAMESFDQQNTGSKMPVEDPNSMKLLALTGDDSDENQSLPVLVGASYGSSFVGFVHFEQVEDTSSYQEAESAAVQARAQADEDLFFENIQGSWGLDAQTSSSLKNLVSSSNIQSHCSLITMGLIPSIKSSQITAVVYGLKSDPASNMAELAAMQQSSDDSNATIASDAKIAKQGQAMSKMSSDYVKAAVSAVAAVDTTQNSVIDLNSLQTALDDYVKKASDGKTGVPINFYIKYITRKDIARAWMEKYYPAMLHDPAAANA